MSSDLRLIIFAKTPVAGAVKTRLQPQCSPTQCRDIARILLRETLRASQHHWPGKVILSTWPSASDPWVLETTTEFGVDIIGQNGADLGERMRNALGLCGYPAAVIGADTADMKGELLRQAHQLLCDGHNVIGPSLDGGYYLLGLVSEANMLFHNVDWGSERVLTQTLNIAHRQGISFNKLAMLNDIDDWSDLRASDSPALQSYLRSQRLV